MLQESINGDLKIAYKKENITKDDKVLFFDENGKFLNYKNGKNDICFLNEVQYDLEAFNKSLAVFAFEILDEKYFIYKVTNKNDIGKFNSINKQEVLRSYLEKDSYIILSGWHIYNWYENTKYCGRCGHILNHKETERAKICSNCGTVYYPQIAPAIIVAISYSNKLLLTKYANNKKARYALVAGFIEVGETPEDAVRREVAEEVGLKVKNIKYYASQPWGITGGLLLGYTAMLDGDSNITLDLSELSEGTWMTKNEIEKLDISNKTLTGTLINEWVKNN